VKPKKKPALKAVATRLSVEVSFLQECFEHGAVPAEHLPELSAAELARLRRLQRLCESLDVDVYAGSIIVALLEELEELRRLTGRA